MSGHFLPRSQQCTSSSNGINVHAELDLHCLLMCGVKDYPKTILQLNLDDSTGPADFVRAISSSSDRQLVGENE